MKWSYEYTAEAFKDLKKLDHSQRKIVLKAIDKVSNNPLPNNEGGYGKPLGNKSGYNLTGCLKVKLKKEGLRIIYKLERHENKFVIIIIGIRDDMEVYSIANDRLNNLK